MNAKALIEELFRLNAEIADFEAKEIKPRKKRVEELKDELLAHLQEEGVDTTAVRGVGSVAVQSAVVPQVEDWDQFYQYIRDNNAFFLLNRAPNAAAYREAVNIEGEIPGVKSFTRVTLRTLKSSG